MKKESLIFINAESGKITLSTVDNNKIFNLSEFLSDSSKETNVIKSLNNYSVHIESKKNKTFNSLHYLNKRNIEIFLHQLYLNEKKPNDINFNKKKITPKFLQPYYLPNNLFIYLTPLILLLVFFIILKIIETTKIKELKNKTETITLLNTKKSTLEILQQPTNAQLEKIKLFSELLKINKFQISSIVISKNNFTVKGNLAMEKLEFFKQEINNYVQNTKIKTDLTIVKSAKTFTWTYKGFTND